MRTFEQISKAIPAAVRFATKGTLNNLEGNIEARVFESGKQGIDANGVIIKQGRKYSSGYAAFRKEAGLQTNYIDLQFTGNLLRSITTIEDQEGGKVIFSTQDGANKAADIERKFSQVIFAASQDEVEFAYRDFERLFFIALNEELATL